jgi:hypothetical protein
MGGEMVCVRWCACVCVEREIVRVCVCVLGGGGGEWVRKDVGREGDGSYAWAVVADGGGGLSGSPLTLDGLGGSGLAHQRRVRRPVPLHIAFDHALAVASFAACATICLCFTQQHGYPAWNSARGVAGMGGWGGERMECESGGR